MSHARRSTAVVGDQKGSNGRHPVLKYGSVLAVIALVLWIAAGASANTFTGNIYTIAGTGAPGFGGDNHPANAAQLRDPTSISPLPNGGFLFIDTWHFRVRRVWPDGTITTVAGTDPPAQGFGAFGQNYGDNGPALGAQLAEPTAVAVLPDGGFLISQTSVPAVRRVWPDGTITTVAGTGVRGFAGDGGLAVDAELDDPRGLAVLPDGGFLVADVVNERIRRVWPDGTITSVAGGGDDLVGDDIPATNARLNFPARVSVLPDGGYLISNIGNGRVRRVSTDGTIRTVAGGGAPADHIGDNGPATDAELQSPKATALPDGGFLIADTGHNRIRRVLPDGTITTIAGTGAQGFGGENAPAVNAWLSDPVSVAVLADGRVAVADLGNNRIRLIDLDFRLNPTQLRSPLNPAAALGLGEIVTFAGTGQAGYAGDTVFAAGQVNNAGVLQMAPSLALLDHPGGVATVPKRRLSFAGLPAGHDMEEEGSLLVADTLNQRIRKITPDGRIWTVAGNGEQGYLVRNAQGKLIPGDGLAAFRAKLNNPTDVSAFPDGSFLIADESNNLIRRVDTNGIIHTVAGQRARNNAGAIAGKGLPGYDGDNQPALSARLDHPQGVTALADGRFYIADTANHIIRRVKNGQIKLVAGIPNVFQAENTLFYPERVIRMRSGDLLISSTAAHAIYRRNHTSKRLSIAAGSGVTLKPLGGGDVVIPDAGFSDDGLYANPRKIGMAFPVGLLESVRGGFLYADSENDRVRRVAIPVRRTVPFVNLRTIAGNGENALRRTTGDFGRARDTSLDRPRDLDRYRITDVTTGLEQDGLMIADTNNNAIRLVLGVY